MDDHQELPVATQTYDLLSNAMRCRTVKPIHQLDIIRRASRAQDTGRVSAEPRSQRTGWHQCPGSKPTPFRRFHRIGELAKINAAGAHDDGDGVASPLGVPHGRSG
jgi:hypothetical protein